MAIAILADEAAKCQLANHGQPYLTGDDAKLQFATRGQPRDIDCLVGMYDDWKWHKDFYEDESNEFYSRLESKDIFVENFNEFEFDDGVVISIDFYRVKSKEQLIAKPWRVMGLSLEDHPAVATVEDDFPGETERVKIAHLWHDHFSNNAAREHFARLCLGEGCTEVVWRRIPEKAPKPQHGVSIYDYIKARFRAADIVDAAEECRFPFDDKKEITNSGEFDPDDAIYSTGDGELAPPPAKLVDIMAKLRKRLHGWPPVVNREFAFVLENGEVNILKSSKHFFGWLSNFGIVNWQSHKTGFVPKDEFFCEWLRTGKQYAGIEYLPHVPPLPNYYYVGREPRPGDGSYLSLLLAKFNGATADDAQLIKAAFAMPMWGHIGSGRPGILATAAPGYGRGVGKSQLLMKIAMLYGGYFDVGTNEDPDRLKNRFLSEPRNRLAFIDNLKIPQYSNGDIENLMTASTISGRRDNVGERSRPNTMTWGISANGVSLSKDLAQRFFPIWVKPPDRKQLNAGGVDWEKDTDKLISDHRKEILADIFAFLHSPAKPLPFVTRMGPWERAIVSRLDDPTSVMETIADRQAKMDGDKDQIDMIRDTFISKLEKYGFHPDTDKIHIPFETSAKWVIEAIGNKSLTKQPANGLIKQAISEGELGCLTENKCNTYGRGFIWQSEVCDAGLAVNYTLQKAIDKDDQERLRRLF